MYPKLLQVAIALNVFTGTWERTLGRRQIKGIENILRTGDKSRHDDGRHDKYRHDDKSDEIVIEPLESYLNRLASNDNQNQYSDDKESRLNNDNNRLDKNKQVRINYNKGDLSFFEKLNRLFNDKQDRYKNDNIRLNNNKRDRIKDDNRDRLIYDNLYRLFNDKQDRNRNDDFRFNNNKRGRSNNDNRDRLFDDNLDRLFSDKQNLNRNDDFRLNNDKRGRSNNDNRDRLFDDNLDRLFSDKQDRNRNDEFRLNTNKRDRVSDDNQDRLFDDDLDRLFDDDQDRFSKDYPDRSNNDNENRYDDDNNDQSFDDSLDRFFDDNQDRLNNDNENRFNGDNHDRLFDGSLDRFFDDKQDRDDDDDRSRFDNDNRDGINANNENRLFEDNRLVDDDIEDFLRKKSEDLCQKTGRCGCGGGRCSESVTDQKIAEDVRSLLDALEMKSKRESRLNELAYRDANEENTLNARNDAVKLADLIRDVNKVPGNNRNKAKNDRILNNKHVDLIVINDLADIEEVLRQSGLLKSDDLEDMTDDDFGDFTRYNAKPRISGKGVVLDLGKFYNESANRNTKLEMERSSSVFHSGEQMIPKDFFKLFGKLKEKATRDLVKYVISQKAEEPNLNIMNFNQKKRIRLLKGEMRRNVEGRTKKDVRSEVEKILFGHGGRIKIVPSDATDNHIMIPNWMYRIVKDENRKLPRPQKKKRMLPLTNKQKIKLIAKSKIPPPSVPLVGRFWRRNFRQNAQKYGLPFQLSLQGLAQYNDQ